MPRSRLPLSQFHHLKRLQGGFKELNIFPITEASLYMEEFRKKHTLCERMQLRKDLRSLKFSPHIIM
jgi:hypothetical protein